MIALVRCFQMLFKMVLTLTFIFNAELSSPLQRITGSGGPKVKVEHYQKSDRSWVRPSNFKLTSSSLEASMLQYANLARF